MLYLPKLLRSISVRRVLLGLSLAILPGLVTVPDLASAQTRVYTGNTQTGQTTQQPVQTQTPAYPITQPDEGALQSNTMIGIRGGLSDANEATPAYTNFTVASRAGILAGGQLDYWITPSFAISGQVLYDQKGNQLTGTSPDNGLPETDNFMLNYLEVPVLAKLALGTGNVKPYLFAGPSIGFLLSGSDHQVQTYNGATYSDQTTDVSNSYGSTDLSLLFGAGVSYQTASGMQIFGDAGYAYGLSNVENTLNTNVTETLNSRDIRVAAGVMFPLK